MTAARARLAALTAVTLWGISFVATKQALAELAPPALIVLRFAIGVAVLGIILRARGISLVPPRSAWRSLALMGFIGIFVHQLIQVNGLARTTAVRTGWLIGLVPIWSAVLSALFLGERFGARKVLGLVAGTAGAIIVVTRGDLSLRALALPSTVGDLLVLASTVNWAVYSIIGRGTLKEIGSFQTTFVAMLLGWMMLLPVFLLSGGWQGLGHLGSPTIASLLFLGIGCSAVGYLCWYAALDRLETSQVAAFLHLEPLVTLVAAVWLLHESVSVSTIVGGLLVLVGVTIVQRAG